MEKYGDWVIILIAAGFLIWLLIKRLGRWLHEPPSARLRKIAQAGGVEANDPVVLMLRTRGYEVLSGKHRIPLKVEVDESRPVATRLYFDYLALKDDRYYIVKLERARDPLDWTASGLRERLLVYALLFPDCEGIMIVSHRDLQIKIVRFNVEAG